MENPGSSGKPGAIRYRFVSSYPVLISGKKSVKLWPVPTVLRRQGVN
jgi:hypothetical protein